MNINNIICGVKTKRYHQNLSYFIISYTFSSIKYGVKITFCSYRNPTYSKNKAMMGELPISHDHSANF